MNKLELKKAYLKNRKDIAKLHNTMTRLSEIRKLNRLNEIAYQNELKKINKVQE